MQLSDIKEKIDLGLEKGLAIELLTEYLMVNGEDEEALTLRGLQYWSMGNRSAAIADYLAAIRINPNGRATQALQAANDILNYYNKDLYNP